MAATFRSRTTATSNATSYTIARPTGVVAGDVLVLVQCSDVGTTAAMTTPSGWTQLLAVDAAGGTSMRGKLWVKTATGSEPATYSLAQGSGADGVAHCFAIQGGVIPTTAASSTAGTSTAVTTPGITPTGSDDLEIRFAAANGAGSIRTFTPAAGFTEPAGADANSNGYTTVAGGYRTLSSSAATSAANWTASGTITAQTRVGFTVAVASAATGTDATATPGVVSATASIPAPSVDADRSATATPAVVSAAASIPAAAVDTGDVEPVEFVAASHSASLTGSLPAGVQQGDVLIGIIQDDVAPGGPSGWTKLGSDRDGATYSANAWAVEVGASSPSLTWSGGGGSPILDIVAYRNTSLPEVYAQSASGSDDAPSVTTTVADSILVCLYGDEVSASITPPPGMVRRSATSDTAYNSAADQTIASPGSTGTRTFGGTEAPIGAWSVVLAPAVPDVHATATPDVVAASAAIPPPTVTADSGATATPAVVTAVASIPAPDVDDGSVTTPPTLVGVTETTASSADIFGADAPAGLQEGDLLIAVHAADIGTLDNMPAPSGGATWQLLDDYSAGANLLQVRIWWKAAGSSEPSSWSFAQSFDADGVVLIAAYRDASDDTPTVAIEPSGDIPTGSVATPGITPPSAASVELRFAAGIPSGAGATTWTAPAGLDELADAQSNVYTTATLAARDLDSDTPTGAETFTASRNQVYWVGVTIGVAGTGSGSGSEDATAEPAVVSASASIPAPSASAGSSASPATVAASASIPSPAASAGSAAAPSTISAAASIPAPAAAAGSTASPGVVAVQVSIPGATVSAGSTASPSTIEASATVPEPAVTAVTTASPEVVTASAAIPEPSPSAGATATTVVVEATASVPAPTTSSGATSEPGVVSATTTIPAATATTGSTASPSVVLATTQVPEPSTSAGSTATAETVEATTTIPEPTVATGQVARPETVTATASIPAPTVAYGQTATPGVVAATASIPSPAVQSGSSSTASPETVEAAASIPEPDVSAGATAQAAVIAAEATIPAPEPSGSSTASPGVVEAAASIPTPTPSAGVTVTPSTVEATTDIPTPTAEADGNATATPGTIAAGASIPSPSTAASSTATPTVVLATAAVPTPTTTVLVAATAQVVEAYATIPAALVSSTARPPVVAAVASIPAPAVSTGLVGDIHAKLGDTPIKRRWRSPPGDPDPWKPASATRRWHTPA